MRARPRPGLTRLGGPEWAWVVAAGALGLVGAVVALRLWHADLGVPFSYQGDALFYEAVVKGALDHGWVIGNPDLGAPSGLDLQDFPLFSVAVVPFLLIKTVGVLTGGDLATTINVYFLLTFSLASTSAYVLLRWLRVSRLVSLSCGLLFAIAPYHLWHGQGHLLASSYYLVPAGVYLALALLRGDELFGRRSGETRPVLRWASPRTFGTLGLCVLIGWSDVYYVAFTLVLVLGAAIGAALAGTSPRRLLVGLGLGGAIAVATLIALTPALIYRLDNGANEEVAKRGGAETETFSTNLAQLVMPVPGHPVAALDDLQQRYRDASEVGREPTPLGLAATIGFLWLVLVALIAVVRPSRGPPAEGSALEDPRDRRLSFAVIIALAFATTGGISALVAWTITPLLRDSGRMAIFIALLSLAGLALLLDRTGRALSHRLRLPPIVLAGALGLLVTVAVLDQTSWKLLPDYAVNEVRWRTDQAFVEQIEGILPSDAQVFQLPYLPFPETRPVFGLGDSGHFTGYVHSHDLRWSYAAMRGREADWQATFSDRPMQEVVPAVVAAGFDGLWLDRAGYSDRAAKVEAELREILGYGPATERADGQALFWDLRAYAAALRGRQSAKRLSLLAESTLEPVRWIHAKGFHERQVAADGSLRWTSEPAAELRLENPSDGERDNELRMQLARPGGTHAFVIVTFPDGREKTLLAKPEGSAVREPLRVPPGRSTLRLRVRAAPIKEGHEGRTLYVQVNQLQIVDPATLVTR